MQSGDRNYNRYFKMGVSLKIQLRFVLLLTVLICACESALTPDVRKFYGSFISGKGLYNEGDGIAVLNYSNYKQIYRTDNAWVIEFYNSWCGHCHKFAPVWKQLAVNMKEWRKIVRLAAIDCADEENTPVCRTYDIMAYPTIKFFSAQAHKNNLGIEIAKTSRAENDITEEVVHLLQKEQSEGRGGKWPNILPYRSHDINNLKKEFETHKDIQFIFLFFVDGEEYLPPQIILDMANTKGIEIRFTSSENEILAKLLGVRTYPSLVVIDSFKMEPEFLRLMAGNRESFRQTIKSYLEEKGFVVPEEPRTVRTLSRHEEPSMIELLQAQENEKFIYRMKEMGDVVFLADLENTLKYSLQHEIASKRLITGDAKKALDLYLAVVAKYFPVGEVGISYLEKLRDKVAGMKEITGTKLKSLLENLSGNNLDKILSTKEEWMGCRGSEIYFRGYPCGIWTLFHYMTVSALRNSEHIHSNPNEVLEAMVGYVKYFFGCTQCSEHFQEMANKSMKEKVTDAEKAVLWLWAAHNEVNQRLANDSMEDPKFPKIQFPSPEKCPKCRDSNNGWIEENVLKYLTTMYHQDNLNYMGSNSELKPSDETDVKKAVTKPGIVEPDSPKKPGKDFNIFDLSLCIILYGVSAVICIGICLKFVLKRRYRKRALVHDLQGRV